MCKFLFYFLVHMTLITTYCWRCMHISHELMKYYDLRVVAAHEILISGKKN